MNLQAQLGEGGAKRRQADLWSLLDSQPSLILELHVHERFSLRKIGWKVLRKRSVVNRWPLHAWPETCMHTCRHMCILHTQTCPPNTQKNEPCFLRETYIAS